MKTIESIYHKVYNFDSLSKAEQDEIIDIVDQDNGQSKWYYSYAVEYLISHVKPDMAMRFLKGYINSPRNRYLSDIVKKAQDKDPKTTREILNNSREECHKFLLCFDNLTIDEEEKGLRSVAKSVYLPKTILESKYKPTLIALKKLPSIMRLKCLRSLTNFNKIASYNMFENISDPEEFKSLLFSSSLKHRDLAEVVWKRYQEISNVGIPSSIKISGHCDLCGDFEFVINSNVIRTPEGLKKTIISGALLSQCFACYSVLQNPPTIIEGDWIK